MKIEKDKVVALSYTLTVDGQIADKATADAPLEYTHGNGMLLPAFESELEGKAEGDGFAFVLSPEEGYGVVDPDMHIALPKAAFSQDGQVREDLLVPGNVIPMVDNNGNLVQGRVLSVDAQNVMMDFNHPMAGKTLHFAGKVESVREASEAEKNGHCCHGKGHCHKHEEGEGHHCCHEEGKECDCGEDCNCDKK